MPASFRVEKFNLALNPSYWVHPNMVFYTLKMMLSSTLCPTHGFLYCWKTSKEGLSNLVTQSVQHSSCQTFGGSDAFLISTLLIHLWSWWATGWPNRGWKEIRTYSITTPWVMMTSLMVVERKDSAWSGYHGLRSLLYLRRRASARICSFVLPKEYLHSTGTLHVLHQHQNRRKGMGSHPSTLSP